MPPEPLDENDWILSCPKCYRWKPLRDTGGVRIGAASKHKRVLGWCRGCKWFRCARLEQVKNIPSKRLDRMLASGEYGAPGG